MIQATQREKSIYGEEVCVQARTQESTLYRLKGLDGGEVLMTSYALFPGIELIYNDVHTHSCGIEKGVNGNLFEINHCAEGRIECRFRKDYLYLGPGDLAISRKDGVGHSSYFPLGKYRGYSLLIDVDRAPQTLSSCLEGVDVRPAEILRRFCSDRCFLRRADAGISRIFAQMYEEPSESRKGYFRIKVLELLLYLDAMELSQERERTKGLSAPQVEIAKNVCRYLTEHMDSHVTLEELASIFHVSGTHLKNCFKGVYGISVYAYIRGQKMQAAAAALRGTDCTVLEVAGQYGYDNGSKFAKAFQEVIGVTPKEYRRRSRAENAASGDRSKHPASEAAKEKKSESEAEGGRRAGELEELLRS
ncbi:MAG: AraC family transcriptional regulator [Eubacteriales bacterium]|nr:AraC family transcriptional regulator [Eubacteriales bacterium]